MEKLGKEILQEKTEQLSGAHMNDKLLVVAIIQNIIVRKKAQDNFMNRKFMLKATLLDVLCSAPQSVP